MTPSQMAHSSISIIIISINSPLPSFLRFSARQNELLAREVHSAIKQDMDTIINNTNDKLNAFILRNNNYSMHTLLTLLSFSPS